MLSTDERGFVGDCLPADAGVRGNEWLGSVGVGGVTSVVGVPERLGGVDGKGCVLIRFRPRLFDGVFGGCSLACWIAGAPAAAMGAERSSVSVSVGSCVLTTLLLLLRCFNSPPIPEAASPTPDLTESVSPPGFLRLIVNALLSFTPGEGSRLLLSRSWGSDGSMIVGMLEVEESATASMVSDCDSGPA